MKKTTKTSVCMATCNGELFIAKQLKSILLQDTPVDEIIISDDSSTDNTVEIIRSFADHRIKLLENNTFKNPIFNFENTLKRASGEYIFLADQDDIWDPAKVSVVSKLLETYDLVINDATIIDAADSVLVDSYFKLRNSGPGILRNFYRNTHLGCCMAFNRIILARALPFPVDIPMHDVWLGMIAELHGKTFFCNDRLTFYRKHDANFSPTVLGKSSYKLSRQVKFRYKLLKELLMRTLVS
jgi:glycosyltransferase involved in cell wall biosynthesis